jgi:hypothetical protein
MEKDKPYPQPEDELIAQLEHLRGMPLTAEEREKLLPAVERLVRIGTGEPLPVPAAITRKLLNDTPDAD